MLADVDVAELGIRDFMVRASEGTMSDPVHLAPVIGVFERAERLQDVRAVVAAPVQHGKTGRRNVLVSA